MGCRGGKIRDEGRGVTRSDATGDGDAGRSDSRKKGADHQGGSRTGSVGEVVSSFGSNGRESGGTRAAADADDRRSGRREQQYGRLNDSFGFRGALEDARRIRA